MPPSFPHTAVQCIAAIAQHHGLQVNPERVIHDYALGAEEPSSTLILRMASDAGLKAKRATLTWEQMLGQKGVFPLILRLKKIGRAHV